MLREFLALFEIHAEELVLLGQGDDLVSQSDGQLDVLMVVLLGFCGQVGVLLHERLNKVGGRQRHWLFY